MHGNRKKKREERKEKRKGEELEQKQDGLRLLQSIFGSCLPWGNQNGYSRYTMPRLSVDVGNFRLVLASGVCTMTVCAVHAQVLVVCFISAAAT